MKLAWILWLANVMPQPAADQLCLATTVYLEARNQSQLGQRAVAEVALRRLEKGTWGKNLCEVVMAPKQFAPTLISPDYRLANLKAWNRAVGVAARTRGLPARCSWRWDG
jgi:spore germination cell wall hydrolase CwlJ-like protein